MEQEPKESEPRYVDSFETPRASGLPLLAPANKLIFLKMIATANAPSKYPSNLFIACLGLFVLSSKLSK